MTKHSIWQMLNRWKVKIILITTIVSTIGIGISQCEAIVNKLDDYAQKYINARVDKKIQCITNEVNALKGKVEDNTKEVERNNKELKRNTELLDTLIKEMAKKSIRG